jgi:hypothetical protein
MARWTVTGKPGDDGEFDVTGFAHGDILIDAFIDDFC